MSESDRHEIGLLDFDEALRLVAEAVPPPETETAALGAKAGTGGSFVTASSRAETL